MKKNKNTRKNAATKFTQKVTKKLISNSIENHLSNYQEGNNLSIWKVGITNDPDRRFGEMTKDFGAKRLIGWHCWDAKTLASALEAEKTYCNKGMKRCNSQVFHGDDSKYVYVYQLPVAFRNNPKY